MDERHTSCVSVGVAGYSRNLFTEITLVFNKFGHGFVGMRVNLTTEKEDRVFIDLQVH
jgi:hypothetical protein